ncbi:MauE/DoxX family redox-associated membrane protein [Gordonia lacunae]|uniref:DoxX family protein n=1 Tax=Gordonia lacunae TaxID=417102 RepID=UPI0039E24014
MSIISPTTTRQPLGRAIARIALGAVLAVAGVGHLTVQREEFQAQVPDWVPFSKDLVVLASGGVEIALGAALIALPRHRKVVSWVVAAFFVVIFPGNINQYVEHIDAFGLDTDEKRLTRLFFQPVLVLWAIAAGTGERRA